MASVLKAFRDERTWSQADLARKVGVPVERIRNILETLEAQEWPFTREVEHPQVYWSLPEGWYPEGALIPVEDVPDLLRLLGRAPRSRARDRILKRIARASATGPQKPVWLVPELGASEESHLPLIEDSAGQRCALFMHYYSASRGACDWRHVSVQKMVAGQHSTFCAVCHRTGELRWWRSDRVLDARLAEHEPYREMDSATVQRFLDDSVNGFFAKGDAIESSFFVREPESRWVAMSLPQPLVAEAVEGGIRVRGTTAALKPIARIVLGLGAAARPETKALAGLVLELARGAIESAQGVGSRG